MIALLQVAFLLGVLVRYILTTLLNMYLTKFPFLGEISIDERWVFYFYLQSILIWELGFCLLFS